MHCWARSLQTVTPKSRHASTTVLVVYYIFSERDTYVHVRYMLSAVRLSVVCLSSVTLVHPTQPVEIFRNFFSPYASTGTLVF